ncbi:MAG TPA: hypothetical protein VFJ98_01235 [Mycobacteriales bacterium]|nr:hypothetical protein [Mycobacteriales bacterium]
MHRRLAVVTTAAALVAGGGSLLTAAHADGLPADYPSAGCFTYDDPKGDAFFTLDGQNVDGPDPDLDILGAALETTDTSLKAYVKVDGLSDAGPNDADGHRYTLKFTFNKHVFTAAGSDYGSGSGDSGSGQIRDGLADAGQAGHVTQLGVDTPAVDPTNPDFFTNKGFVDSGLKVTFDYTNSWVVIDLPIADIEKYGGAPFTGAISEVSVVSATDEYLVSSQWDSTVKDNGTTSTDTWTVGDNACFGPPAALVANLGATRVQYGDTAALAAKVTDASGAALADVPVTFAIGRLLTTATTDDDGIAKARLTPTVVAGGYALVERFAGNDTVGRATFSTPFTVATEKALLTLSTKRSGSTRLVTATLRDDDRHALAQQRVVWFVNGRSAGRSTTSGTGTATFRARAGQTVKVVFAAVAGKYTGASASRKV